MLPPLPTRKSYDDVPRDSLAYALFLNPLMEVDPLDNNNDEPPTLKTLTARLKHLPGKHDQSAHGKPGRVGSAFRGAYSAARAGGAGHVEARNQAKTAAEQVRQTIRGEKRAERIANPKPKRTQTNAPEYPHEIHARLIASRGELQDKLSDIRRQISDANPSKEEYEKLIQQGDSIKGEIGKISDELFLNQQKWQERYAAAESARTEKPPRAETPATTKWQSFLDKSKAEYAAAQDAYQAAISDKNATMESLTAAQRARDAAGDKWTRDQATANQMAAVESAAPPPRTTPTTPITPTTSRTRQSELQDAMASGVTERRAISTRLEQIQQEMAKYTTPDSPYNSDDPRYGRLRDERATLRARNGTLEADYDKQLTELQKLQAQPRTPTTPTTPTAPTTPKAQANPRAQEIDALLPRLEKQYADIDAAANQAKAEMNRLQLAWVRKQATMKQVKAAESAFIDLDTKREGIARQSRSLRKEREGLTTTKADDSVGGVPRKYGARAGEVIAGNLGRDTGGKFTRVGGEGAIVRAAINRGIAAAGGGKRGAKRAAVSAAQKKRQQADTGAGVMDKLGFDASDWDYLASDKPQDASDPQFTRLIEQGLMDNVGGMAYPSALGRKVAAAAGAGNEDKAKELLARDTAKRGARQAKIDAQISAYDEVIGDETASPRARAIAARKRTVLIGQSGTSTKASDGYAPPDGVRAQAKRGLALRSEFGRGGTSVGIARARDLSNGKRMSRDTIMRMVSFFARHAVDKRPDWGNPSKPSNGYIAHLLWGGDAGKSWANKIANQIKAGE